MIEAPTLSLSLSSCFINTHTRHEGNVAVLWPLFVLLLSSWLRLILMGNPLHNTRALVCFRKFPPPSAVLYKRGGLFREKCSFFYIFVASAYQLIYLFFSS